MSEGKQSEAMTAAVAEAAMPAAALEAAFRAHHARVFRTAYRITGSSSDAEDVLQTVFLRLMERRPGEPVSDPAWYLHRAAVNAALDVLRSRQRAALVSLEEAGASLPCEAGPNAERLHASLELRESLRRAMARLSPKAAEIFLLRYIEGYGYRQIARMLGASLSNVAVTLHRTRRQLRRDLACFPGRRHET